eukprot:gene6022-5894_t
MAPFWSDDAGAVHLQTEHAVSGDREVWSWKPSDPTVFSSYRIPDDHPDMMVLSDTPVCLLLYPRPSCAPEGQLTGLVQFAEGSFLLNTCSATTRFITSDELDQYDAHDWNYASNTHPLIEYPNVVNHIGVFDIIVNFVDNSMCYPVTCSPDFVYPCPEPEPAVNNVTDHLIALQTVDGCLQPHIISLAPGAP